MYSCCDRLGQDDGAIADFLAWLDARVKQAQDIAENARRTAQEIEQEAQRVRQGIAGAGAGAKAGYSLPTSITPLGYAVLGVAAYWLLTRRR